MIYLKTDVDFSDLQNHGKFIDANGNPVEGIKVSPIEDNGVINFKISYNGNEQLLNNSLYEKCKMNPTEQLIKINFRSRVRRVDVDKIKLESNSFNEDSNETEYSFDFENFDVSTTKLRDINFNPKIFEPIQTGTYLDTFVSYKNGIMPGINVMVTGDPGVGKSSNLMDILVNVKKNDPTKRVLYVSAEMNELDVKEFEQYYPGLEDIDFLYISNYVTDPELNIQPYQALMSVLYKGWDIVVMDSIVEVQSMIQEDLSFTSKKAEKWMLDLMKTHNNGHNKNNSFTTFLCIQQMNKGGTYVGSKRLEHMTSAFLTLCWDKKENGKRYMMFEKNRKGKEKIKLYYSFDKVHGIVYDEVRHGKECLIMERLQTSSEIGVDEFDLNSFHKLFSETEE